VYRITFIPSLDHTGKIRKSLFHLHAKPLPHECQATFIIDQFNFQLLSIIAFQAAKCQSKERCGQMTTLPLQAMSKSRHLKRGQTDLDRRGVLALSLTLLFIPQNAGAQVPHSPADIPDTLYTSHFNKSYCIYLLLVALRSLLGGQSNHLLTGTSLTSSWLVPSPFTSMPCGLSDFNERGNDILLL